MESDYCLKVKDLIIKLHKPKRGARKLAQSQAESFAAESVTGDPVLLLYKSTPIMRFYRQGAEIKTEYLVVEAE